MQNNLFMPKLQKKMFRNVLSKTFSLEPACMTEKAVSALCFSEGRKIEKLNQELITKCDKIMSPGINIV